jgi:hypothetical protein
MIDIDRFYVMLNEVCEELPDDFFRELHYGVHLSEECKSSPYADDGSMIIMGEYNRSNRGNKITIYYAENTWNFTKLGHINHITQEELKALIGDGDVTVSLSIQ